MYDYYIEIKRGSEAKTLNFEILLPAIILFTRSVINFALLASDFVPDIKAISAGYGKSLLEKFTTVKKQTLNKKLKNTEEDAYDLLSKLVVFNPLNRITSSEALKHSYVKM